ncbi:hypothetical protein SFMTTN_2350 [Sulfuriferula multivorans]|uniref:Uncharacterized protein n=1 Tax=Sulfuriferula multivorans TaxID=1559896 RepID=A0A401JFX1_9PROT|nr:hypothetical protein SFMTTN_2350 [Sulfuriferula multivorans]
MILKMKVHNMRGTQVLEAGVGITGCILFLQRLMEKQP